MLPVLFVLLLAIPVLELWVIIQVGQEIGALSTIAVLVLISVLGAVLLKQQGMAAWARLQATLARGEIPAREVSDGALILFGGALLLTPGFLTDLVGLLLLFPPTRALVKRGFRRLLARWAERRFVPPGAPRIYTTTATRARRNTEGKAPGATDPPGPRRSFRSGEDDSPHRE